MLFGLARLRLLAAIAAAAFFAVKGIQEGRDGWPFFLVSIAMAVALVMKYARYR